MRLRAGPWRRCATATASASPSRSGASTSSSRRRNWRGARRHPHRCRSAAMPASTAARSCRPTAAAISISCASTRSAMAAPEPVAAGAAALPERARVLLDVWFGAPGDSLREERREIWFRSTPEHDDRLRELFFADYERAAAGALADWEAAPESALALVLLLDQIPRNIFRATPRVYVTDALARAVADRAMANGFDM